MYDLTNSCEYNEANLTEAMTVQFRASQGRKNLILYIVAGLVVALCLYNWLALGNQKHMIYAAILVVMCAALFFTNRTIPGRAARRQVPLIREKNGGLRFQVQFREDGVAMIGPTGEETSLVPYGQLEKLVETEHLILLFNREKHMILLDRAGFRGGSEANFWQLLRDKRPALLPKERES